MSEAGLRVEGFDQRLDCASLGDSGLMFDQFRVRGLTSG